MGLAKSNRCCLHPLLNPQVQSITESCVLPQKISQISLTFFYSHGCPRPLSVISHPEYKLRSCLASSLKLILYTSDAATILAYLWSRKCTTREQGTLRTVHLCCEHPNKVAHWNNGPQFLLVPLNGTHVGGSCRALACQRMWGPTAE